MVSKLACYLVHHAMKVAGLNRLGACLVLPAATGMSVTLVLLTLKAAKPEARCVLHPRLCVCTVTWLWAGMCVGGRCVCHVPPPTQPVSRAPYFACPRSTSYLSHWGIVACVT